MTICIFIHFRVCTDSISPDPLYINVLWKAHIPQTILDHMTKLFRHKFSAG